MADNDLSVYLMSPLFTTLMPACMRMQVSTVWMLDKGDASMCTISVMPTPTNSQDSPNYIDIILLLSLSDLLYTLQYFSHSKDVLVIAYLLYDTCFSMSANTICTDLMQYHPCIYPIYSLSYTPISRHTYSLLYYSYNFINPFPFPLLLFYFCNFFIAYSILNVHLNIAYSTRTTNTLLFWIPYILHYYCIDYTISLCNIFNLSHIIILLFTDFFIPTLSLYLPYIPITFVFLPSFDVVFNNFVAPLKNNYKWIDFISYF